MERKFKPFERIIVKRKDKSNDAVSLWTCAEFSHYNGNFIALVGGYEYDVSMFDILPYVGNELLVGTNNMPSEQITIQTGECVLLSNDTDELKYCIGELRLFDSIMFCEALNTYRFYESKIKGNAIGWNYCIPLSKIHPNDSELTRKEILQVNKFGRVEKVYKTEI